MGKYLHVIACNKREAFVQGSEGNEAIQLCARGDLDRFARNDGDKSTVREDEEKEMRDMNATSTRYVRIAELEVDPAQLESFAAAITEEIEAAVRVEPGVLALYAVSEKDDPVRVRVFEIYADEQAYRTHLETPHFLKFRAVTGNMVLSRKLIDAVPIALVAKAE